MAMIRVTILFNLQPHVDEEEFLVWRLNDLQKGNTATSGVVRSDFSRVDEGWPRDVNPPYRFMTTLDWPDKDSFAAGFYGDETQAKILEDIKILKDPVFLISEILSIQPES
jgi:hypothetical protein